MNSQINLTVISNNHALDNFESEHGFSLLIETDEKITLFDTGNGSAFTHNIKKLGINKFKLDNLVISHGHYDHCGNIPIILNSYPNIVTYIHPKAVQERFSIHPERDPVVRYVGINSESKAFLTQIVPIWTSTPTQVTQRLNVTGEIPRESIEDTGGPFFLDKEGIIPDIIPDDQTIWITTTDGLVVITGCCHSGIINTINYIKKVSGISKVRTVIGGLHLLHASRERLDKTIDYLNSLNLQSVYPGHCTGEQVIEELKVKLNTNVISVHAGDKINID